MTTPQILKSAAALLFFLACGTTNTIQYIPIDRLEPPKRLITIHHQSAKASMLMKQSRSKGEYSSLFFCKTSDPIASNKFMYGPDEVIAFYEQNRANQPIDGILLTISNPEMYSAKDLMLRRELILSCFKSSVLVFVQEPYASKPQLYQALPFGQAPNHSMHQTLPLRGIAGDFES